MSEGKKRGPSGRSRAEWERLVAAYEQRSVPRRVFCAQAGISSSSLAYWQKKLEGNEPGAAGFIEVSPTDAFRDRSPSGWDLELALGDGVVLRLARR